MSKPESSKMDFFELGDKTSLICGDSSTTDAAKDTLRELGFKFHTAETPELAIKYTTDWNWMQPANPVPERPRGLQ